MNRLGVARILFAAACLCSTAYASVIVGGNEWRQLTDTEGFTWNQVNAVCPTDGTACTGFITRTDGTRVDVTGWTWASIEDIRALFDDIVQPGTVNIPTIANYFEPPDWTYIDNIIGTGPSQFAPTYQDGASYFVTGWTATSWGTSSYAYSPYLRDFWTLQYNDTAGLQSLTITGLASSGTGDLGVWLYRPVAVGLASLTLSKAEVAGCKNVTGKVTLSSPAPVEGTVVTIADTLPAATSPLPVKVAEGATTKTFVIKTDPVSVSESGTVSATVGSTTLSQPLTVRPMGLTSVTLTPSTLVGGNAVLGKATLECKAEPGPVTVNLTSSNPAVARPVAASIVVPQGLQLEYFTVTTNAVQSKSYATISGVANGITKSKMLTVNVAAAVSPTRLGFGSVTVNTTSGVLKATLTNKGATAFSVSSIGLTGTNAKYYAQTNDCPANLAADASCTIGVTFKPIVTGNKSATLSIATSATSSPLKVMLSGTGI